MSLCLFEINKQLERYSALALHFEYLYSNLRLTKLLLCNNSYATKFLTLCCKYFFLMLEKFRNIALASVTYQNLVVGSMFSAFPFFTRFGSCKSKWTQQDGFSSKQIGNFNFIFQTLTWNYTFSFCLKVIFSIEISWSFYLKTTLLSLYYEEDLGDSTSPNHTTIAMLAVRLVAKTMAWA
jgi:hypothetical protein